MAGSKPEILADVRVGPDIPNWNVVPLPLAKKNAVDTRSTSKKNVVVFATGSKVVVTNADPGMVPAAQLVH